MQNITIDRTLIFWVLVIALLSSISTTIFSESTINDTFGFSLMAVAIIGLCFNITLTCIQTLFDICNPSN